MMLSFEAFLNRSCLSVDTYPEVSFLYNYSFKSFQQFTWNEKIVVIQSETLLSEIYCVHCLTSAWIVVLFKWHKNILTFCLGPFLPHAISVLTFATPKAVRRRCRRHRRSSRRKRRSGTQSKAASTRSKTLQEILCSRTRFPKTTTTWRQRRLWRPSCCRSTSASFWRATRMAICRTTDFISHSLNSRQTARQVLYCISLSLLSIFLLWFLSLYPSYLHYLSKMCIVRPG